MKLLAVTQSANIIGGANRSFLDVLTILRDEYNYEICVLAPDWGEFTEAAQKNGFECIIFDYLQTSAMNYGNWKSFASQIINCRECWNNQLSVKKNAKLLENRGFDLVYINDTTNTVGYYISKLLKIPFVWHFRGYNSRIVNYLPKVEEKRLRKIKLGKYIVISKAMMNFMGKKRGLAEDSMVVIYNGVKEKNNNIYKKWSDSITNEFHCLQCGHLSIAKGQMDAIGAIAVLKNKGYKNIYLHLAGTPAVSHGVSYKDVLDKRISELGINDQIIYEGEVKDMESLRQKMQIELMCSVAEPFGRVTVEGMQAGLVVIGADTGATPEIINDGLSGLIYQQGNSDSLAECIERIYLNHGLGDSLSENAYQYTRTHFTMEENVKTISEVLESMTEETR